MEIINKTILAIAPHLDDIELGCFGSLHKLSLNNKIYYLGLSFPNNIDKKDILETSVYKSLEMLSISKENFISYDYSTRNLYDVRSEVLQNFYDVNKKINPDIIFIPSSYDIHQTHQIAHEEALRIFKNKTILGYEFPWNNFSFKPDVFIKLKKENLKAKEHIISQFPSHGKNSFFENGIIKDLANLRGKQIGGGLAESFELIRLVCE